MTAHDDSVTLRQVLDHAQEAVALSRGRSRSDLESDRVLGLAFLQLVQILGEAANRMSKQYREQHPEIPWSQIIALRNRLIHGYDTIDFDILWNILKEDLPRLVSVLEQITPPPDEPE